MGARRRRVDLGTDFARLWAAYTISEIGSAIGTGALPLIAVLLLHSSTWQVSFLAALSGFAGAAMAIPLGPAIERRKKRPVMIAADLIRAGALISVPLSAWADVLTYVQLCIVSALCTVATIVFTAASGAHLKALVHPEERAAATSRFESTFWFVTSIGAPLGGLLISWLGSVTTLIVDAASYLASALGVRSIHKPEPPPPAHPGEIRWRQDVMTGWSYILGHPGLRALFFNAMMFGGSLMMAGPLQAVLMLRELGFQPWQYGLVLGLPCLGGLAGAGIMPRLVARFGARKVLLVAGVARTLWLAPIALAPSGFAGVMIVLLSDFFLLFFAGIFNPTFVTYRMRETPDTHMTRVGAAWSISSKTVQPVFILIGGTLAGLIATRTAILIAAGLLLTSCLFLPWRGTKISG